MRGRPLGGDPPQPVRWQSLLGGDLRRQILDEVRPVHERLVDRRRGVPTTVGHGAHHPVVHIDLRAESSLFEAAGEFGERFGGWFSVVAGEFTATPGRSGGVPIWLPGSADTMVIVILSDGVWEPLVSAAHAREAKVTDHLGGGSAAYEAVERTGRRRVSLSFGGGR